MEISDDHKWRQRYGVYACGQLGGMGGKINLHSFTKSKRNRQNKVGAGISAYLARGKYPG